MSIRIHELAKKYNMEGRDMLALLKERGYVAADTKSVSSTLSKIYVEEIEKEFAAKAAAAQASAPVPAPAAPVATSPQVEAPKHRVPVGLFVKTVQDIAREREIVAKAAAPVRPPAPLAKAPMAPPVRFPRPVRFPPRRLSRPRTAQGSCAHCCSEGAGHPPGAASRRCSQARGSSAPAAGACGLLSPALPQVSPAPVVTMQGDIKIIHLKPRSSSGILRSLSASSPSNSSRSSTRSSASLR